MRKVNIIGMGLMGRQIAALFCCLGYEVNVFHYKEFDVSCLDAYINKIKDTLFREGGKVKLVLDIQNFGNNLTVEAITEDLELKRYYANLMSKTITTGYFTNTSSYSPLEIGENVGVFHFFNPIKMKLVEFFNPLESKIANGIIDDLIDNGFEVVNVKSNRGFVGNYLLFSEISTMFVLMEKHGYSLPEIEKMQTKLYGKRNLIKIIDIIGVDVTLKILENLNEQEFEFYIPKLIKQAVETGVLGKKNNTSLFSLLN